MITRFHQIERAEMSKAAKKYQPFYDSDKYFDQQSEYNAIYVT